LRSCFTWKSIGLGTAGALFICAAAYPNDFMVRSNWLVGNHLPVGVFGSLLFFALFLRPLAARRYPALAYSNAETAVVVAMMLAACGVATSGLMRYFPALMTGPYTRQITNQQWRTTQTLKYTPDKLVPEGWYTEGEDPELDAAMTPAQRQARERRAGRVCTGLSRGLVTGRRTIGFDWTADAPRAIPIGSWLPILRYWGPFFVIFCVFILMMMVIVHRQWSRNELLPYPVAELASAMIHTKSGRAWPALFYEPRFWTAFAAVAFVHFVRFVHAWNPDTMIDIPLEWRLYPIRNHFPRFAAHAYQSYGVFSGRFYFAAFAFAYFIPTEVSFSLGVTPFVLALLGYAFWSTGYNFQWRNVTDSGSGAYMGMTFIILLLGRHYYWNVIKTAFGVPVPDDEVPSAVRMAARLFLTAFLLLVVMAVWFGLPVYFAVLAILGMGVMFLVTARIIAETGSFFIKTVWMPFYLLFGLVGGRAIGPYSQSVFGLITNLFCWDPREQLSPFVINALRICEKEGVPRFKMANVMAAVLVPCMAAAFLANLWVNYNGRGSDYAILRGNMFNRIAATVQRERMEPKRFERMCRLDKNEGVFDWEAFAFRLRNVAGRRDCLRWVLFGFAAVVFCYYMKLHYRWWILHPIVFLVWGNSGGRTFSVSFLAGCLVKTLVTKYGGGRVYQRLKPVFFGFILAEICMASLIMLFNVWYYVHYGVRPVRYYIFPA